MTSQAATIEKVEPRTHSRPKRFILKLVTFLISALLCLSVLIGIDLYLHHKHGINWRGYRGPSLGAKQTGEKRVAILGGSTTWGFGLQAGQDFPAQLQRLLAQRADIPHAAPINVLNLGFNNDGAYSFRFTLKDYDYLQPDVIVLYSGYNDLNEEQNYYVYRHRSPIFVWTGFLPLLPSLTVDKLTVWKRQLTGTDKRTIFQPPDLKKLDTPLELQKQIGTLNQPAPANRESNNKSCPPEWQFYCDQISETVQLSLSHGQRVLVVTEPYISDRHVLQQRALRDTLAARFANEPNLGYLDLGRAIDLRDPSLCWDGMHLTAEGNHRIADAMSGSIVELLKK